MAVTVPCGPARPCHMGLKRLFFKQHFFCILFKFRRLGSSKFYVDDGRQSEVQRDVYNNAHLGVLDIWSVLTVEAPFHVRGNTQSLLVTASSLVN